MLNNIIDRVKLPFRKEKELYLCLREIIGFIPHNIGYYQLALMHKSTAHRNEKGRLVNNERLEFLGDAILDAIVGDIVYQHFPGKREGFLTNTRSKIVQRGTLNRLAGEMGITRLVKTNGQSSNSHNSYMGGNAFEALVGAIYLDKGYDACMRFMEKRILGEIINLDKMAYKEMNFKSKLIEWGQKRRMEIVFDMLDEQKDEHGSPIFHFRVLIEGVEGAEGHGFSKKESQQLAAKETLNWLKKDASFLEKVHAAKKQHMEMEEESALQATEEMQEETVFEEQTEENLRRKAHEAVVAAAESAAFASL
ncbi:MAG: ribonuclease III [Prevotella sp.]|nr:ribonuclease III [Prevotella sp.]